MAKTSSVALMGANRFLQKFIVWGGDRRPASNRLAQPPEFA